MKLKSDDTYEVGFLCDYRKCNHASNIAEYYTRMIILLYVTSTYPISQDDWFYESHGFEIKKQNKCVTTSDHTKK